MSGDHNMYQNDDPGRFGRNWNGHPFGEKDMLEQKRGAILGGEYRHAAVQEVERPKMSNIQDQMGHMENHIHFLVNAIDTLESRLSMVLRDEPAEAVSEGLTKSMCPLAITLHTFNRRLDHASKGIMSLIDRLEV
jgi:hypothetical protein